MKMHAWNYCCRTSSSHIVEGNQVGGTVRLRRLASFTTTTWNAAIGIRIMGDNANVDWAWKNTIVGEGYQAKGVIRQRTAQSSQVKVVNMSAVPASKSSAAPAPALAPAPAPVQRSEDRTKRDRDEAGAHRGDKKRKKDNKDSSRHKKSKKDHKESKHDRDRAGSERDSFNPLLQCLASRLSNKTRIFTLENE